MANRPYSPNFLQSLTLCRSPLPKSSKLQQTNTQTPQMPNRNCVLSSVFISMTVKFKQNFVPGSCLERLFHDSIPFPTPRGLCSAMWMRPTAKKMPNRRVRHETINLQISATAPTTKDKFQMRNIAVRCCNSLCKKLRTFHTQTHQVVKEVSGNL